MLPICANLLDRDYVITITDKSAFVDNPKQRIDMRNVIGKDMPYEIRDVVRDSH